MSLFSDCNRARRNRAAADHAERNQVILHSLTKDGMLSRMRDAIKRFPDYESAEAEASRVRALNPGKTLRWAMMDMRRTGWRVEV